jgi:hypothetical protein
METTSSPQQDEIRISDFGLIAALVTSGFGIRRTERSGNRMFFVFENTDPLNDATYKYWAGTLQVYARQLVDNTKMLKSMIYGEK